jgi:Zn-dependent peptidase ImmA (M78 family)
VDYCPWEDLARRPDIVCRSCALPGVDGLWFPDLKAIALDERLDRAGRRSALAHELVHVDRGDVQVAHIGPDGPRLARRQEARADQEAARRLVTADALAFALASYPYDLAAVADELEVTLAVVVCRIENLHPAEHGYLRIRMGSHEHVA